MILFPFMLLHLWCVYERIPRSFVLTTTGSVRCFGVDTERLPKVSGPLHFGVCIEIDFRVRSWRRSGHIILSKSAGKLPGAKNAITSQKQHNCMDEQGLILVSSRSIILVLYLSIKPYTN